MIDGVVAKLASWHDRTMRPDGAVKSAKRALEVVELLEKLQGPAGVFEIAAALGYPPSSTSVLLSGLRRLGYLQYDGASRSYALSLRVALIGGGLRVGGQPISRVIELVEHVRHLTKLPTAVATRNETYMQYVYTLVGSGTDLVVNEPGKVLPIFHTASGIALLSNIADIELGRLIRRFNTEVSENKLVSLQIVTQDIEQFKKAGFSTVVDRVREGFGSTAIRLPFDDAFGLPLALSVGAPTSVLAVDGDRLARLLRDAVTKFGWDTKDIPTSYTEWPPVDAMGISQDTISARSAAAPPFAH
jgi:DNA-binding IclR family transcriptional regulator